MRLFFLFLKKDIFKGIIESYFIETESHFATRKKVKKYLEILFFI
jgi:hypothetical protein